VTAYRQKYAHTKHTGRHSTKSISTNIHGVRVRPSLTHVLAVSWRPATTDLRRSLSDFDYRAATVHPLRLIDSRTCSVSDVVCVRHTCSAAVYHTDDDLSSAHVLATRFLLFRVVRDRPHAPTYHQQHCLYVHPARKRSPSSQPPRQPGMSTAVDRRPSAINR